MSVAADLQEILPAPEALPAGLRLSRAITLFAEGVLVFALLGELVVVVANVLGRTFSQTGFMWTGEVAQFALSTMTFIGGVVAYRR
ncbi:MAG: TRAP transporter small permease subunit, partial [Candidatus Eremiobacteraeota bacterium]|nr:TRAP transporter small permease subunit [Candidatus Eremiobacteraeota bacterium]